MSSAELHENNNITVIYHSHIKKIFDEIDEVILKYNESIAVNNNCVNATQDQRENSNVSLVVAPNTDDEVVLCQSDGSVKNEKDETEKFSDDESCPKKSKQLTFIESNLPDSDEEELLKSYPRPKVTESDSMESESESERNSVDESNLWSWRRRKKTKPVTEVTIDKLPTKFLTRQRVPNRYLVCKKYCLHLFQSIYLKSQEEHMNEDIIRENVKRLKTHNKSKGKLDVRIVKPERKDTKSKLFVQKNTNNSSLDYTPAAKNTISRTRCLKNKTDGKNMKRSKPHNKGTKHKKKTNVGIKKPERKNTKSTPLAQKLNKKSTLDPISAAKTNTRRSRAMKIITDGRNTKIKSGTPGNIKNDYKRKPTHKKERSTLPALEERRSKRYQKTKKEDLTMKAPVSTPRKSKVYNISPSCSESPKRLKRSLVGDSEVSSPKRTRSQNNNVTPVRVIMKTRHQDEPVTSVQAGRGRRTGRAGRV